MSAPHEPHEDLIEQFRQRALVHVLSSHADPAHTPAETRLLDIERLARLHDIAHNPYHQLAFGGLSNLELMRICAYNLLADADHRNAGKLLREIERIETRQAKAAAIQSDLPGSTPANDHEPTRAGETEPPHA